MRADQSKRTGLLFAPLAVPVLGQPVAGRAYLFDT